MNLTDYLKSLEKHHKKKTQTGFEKNDRRIFIEEILGQLGYSKDNIYEDVPQKGKSPDLRVYGHNEIKSKNTMSRFIIETKNYSSLNKNIDNIDFLQLKNYVKNNLGKIKYIASTDYVSLYLFNADILLREKRLNLETSEISKSEIAGFKSVIVRTFDFTNFSQEDGQKFEMLSHKNLFEIYDFPNPEKYADRFNIQNRAIRENFIKSLYYITEEIKDDVYVKFSRKLNEFLSEYSKISNVEFVDQFLNLINDSDFLLIRNLFLWSFEMNYLPNFIEKPSLIDRNELDRILTKKNPEGKDFYYNEYLVTCIYSIINKTLFIRILEDSGVQGGYIFIHGEKEGRYLSNGIVHEKFLEGKLKQYVFYIFQFKNKDLQQFHFLLKHDIYDWVISEIEEYTLVDFLRVFNEIYLKELDQDILGDIYEHYLQEDRDEEKGKSYRRLLGQYYTPRPIVRFMWYLVRDVLKEEKGIDIYKKNQKLLQILDPFMGSGTFLNESVLQMKAADSGKSIIKGEVFYFFKDRDKERKLEEILTGFEINPLSCSIADINLYFRLIKSFSSDKIKNIPIDDLNLLRINSFDLISRKNNNNNTMQISLFSEEIKSTFTETRKIKSAKSKNYDIIISNPPYGKISPTKFMKEELLPFAYPGNNFDKNGLMIAFNWNQKSRKGEVPKHEKNKGKIMDMYAFAFGVANRLISEGAIVCFITSNTYLSVPSYTWVRKYILDNYKIKYLINFNKTAEKSNSMFEPETSIATSIIVLQKNKDNKDNIVKFLNLSDINSVIEKYKVFAELQTKKYAKNKNDIISFNVKDLNELKFIEVPQSEFRNNIDFIFSKSNDILGVIENKSDFLEQKLLMKSGVLTGDDDLFVKSDAIKLEENIKDFLEKNKYKIKTKMLKEKLGQIKELPTYSSDKIIDFVKEENIEKYYFSNLLKLYYEPLILLRPGEKETKLASHKLIVFDNKATYTIKAVVSEHIVVPKQNNEVRYYISEEDDIDFLYYCCGILNSSLMKYYYTNKMGNRKFPIKIPSKNEVVYKLIVDYVKDIHKIKSDYQKLLSDKIDFKSGYFKNIISKEIEVYPLEEKNEYFDLQIPKGIGVRLFVESPYISKDDEKLIVLNRDGLKLICKNGYIARMIFNNYFSNAYGNLNELGISINITQTNESKFKKIKEEIQKEIEVIEQKINVLIYALYFDYEVKYGNGTILNDKDILADKNVRKIENFFNKD